MVNATIIQLDRVSKIYSGDARALESTSLSINAGQVTALLGPSGAGKSTLLRCINLLTIPSTGTVWAEGLGLVTPAHNLTAHRRRTGMVFQQHQLILRYTALRNVLTGRVGYHSFFRGLLPPTNDDIELSLRALERVALLSKALLRADALSGGEQQRVGIARALAQEPTLILADEPVASLDPASSQKIMRLLRQICVEGGITLVASLHQVALALEHADRIVGLNSGRVVFDGAPEDIGHAELEAIYGTPAHPSPVLASNSAKNAVNQERFHEFS